MSPAPGLIPGRSKRGRLLGLKQDSPPPEAQTPAVSGYGNRYRRSGLRSLLAGDLTGNFRELRLGQAIPARIGAAAAKICDKFPSPQRQGVHSAGTGEAFRRGNELSRPAGIRRTPAFGCQSCLDGANFSDRIITVPELPGLPAAPAPADFLCSGARPSSVDLIRRHAPARRAAALTCANLRSVPRRYGVVS